MSGDVSISGTSQFPKPPIKIGITIKKIIMKAWAVTIVLYSCSLSRKGPGWPSSTRMTSLKVDPIIPDQIPIIKYRVPMSLWLVEVSHRM